jgi:hypothetical protein
MLHLYVRRIASYTGAALALIVALLALWRVA